MGQHPYKERLGCPFPKCFPAEYQYEPGPCTTRPGFDGFRLLNEHIWKYHSFRYRCQICRKRFSTVSQEKIDGEKADHIARVHGGSRKSSSPSSSSSSSRKSSSKRSRHHSDSSDESAMDDYWSQNDMTKEQDIAFKRWLDSASKAKKPDIKTKYQSLFQCLFGTDYEPPENPYYDYLLTMNDVNERLQALGLGTLSELERQSQRSRSGSFNPVAHRSAPPTRTLQPTTQADSSYAFPMPSEEIGDPHLASSYAFQSPYNTLYSHGETVDTSTFMTSSSFLDTSAGAAMTDGVDDGGDYSRGLPGTHAPHHHHHHHASHPPSSSYHHRAAPLLHHAPSWTVSDSGPPSGYLSIDSEAMPRTPLAVPADGQGVLMDLQGVYAGADGLVKHAALRPGDRGRYDSFGGGMRTKSTDFDGAAILGLDQRLDDIHEEGDYHGMSWDGMLAMDEFQ